MPQIKRALSRIWGGIHPPMDDIRGRIIGEKIGVEAFHLAMRYFDGTAANGQDVVSLYPIPFQDNIHIENHYDANITLELYGLDGKLVYRTNIPKNSEDSTLALPYIAKGVYIAKINNDLNEPILTKKVIKI